MKKIVIWILFWLLWIFWLFSLVHAQTWEYSCIPNQTWDSWCLSNEIQQNTKSLQERFWFFLILIPAAVSDSINPCEFAILLILLSAILTKHNNRRKVIIAWLLFSLSIFISYLLMWIGIYKALATSWSTTTLKVIVWIVGIVVGLFNLKDYFFPDKWISFEVPHSWRPKMQKLASWVVSPLGAFLIGFLISLFLLPCTSGPYITILWYLASESNSINFWWYIYLLMYNIIFILPMLIITWIVWFGFMSIKQLSDLRKKNIWKLHLIVGLLMIGLGLFVLYQVYF